MDERHQYFGFEISIPPTNDAFKKSCLRVPDFLFEISSIKSGAITSWLILWRSYENCQSERGLVLKDKREVDHENCLSFLPLGVVLFGLADMNTIGRVCTRFFSIIPHSADNKNDCDIPPINLRLIRDHIACSANNIHIKVCTLRHLNSLFRRKKLVPISPWKVPNEIIEQYAFDLFTRALCIASTIHDERSFQCLLPFYRELRCYGGLLLGSFEERNRYTAEAEEKGRNLFRSLMREKWYPGSRHQQKTYPSGLMKDWVEDIERYVLYDFQPARRLKIMESGGKGYMIECNNEQDALFFDTAKCCHVLPENAPPILIHSSTQDWIRMAP